jgi:hypothetical protein
MFIPADLGKGTITSTIEIPPKAYRSLGRPVPLPSSLGEESLDFA